MRRCSPTGASRASGRNLIVAQDDRRVERYWRGEEGEWRQGEAVGEGSKVPIPCPGPVEVTLSKIYEGLG